MKVNGDKVEFDFGFRMTKATVTKLHIEYDLYVDDIVKTVSSDDDVEIDISRLISCDPNVRDKMPSHTAGCRIFMDGDMWCAVNDDFVDIQESVAGFGKTPDIALAELLNQNKTHLQ